MLFELASTLVSFPSTATSTNHTVFIIVCNLGMVTIIAKTMCATVFISSNADIYGTRYRGSDVAVFHIIAESFLTAFAVDIT